MKRPCANGRYGNVILRRIDSVTLFDRWQTTWCESILFGKFSMNSVDIFITISTRSYTEDVGILSQMGTEPIVLDGW